MAVRKYILSFLLLLCAGASYWYLQLPQLSRPPKGANPTSSPQKSYELLTQVFSFRSLGKLRGTAESTEELRGTLEFTEVSEDPRIAFVKIVPDMGSPNYQAVLGRHGAALLISPDHINWQVTAHHPEFMSDQPLVLSASSQQFWQTLWQRFFITPPKSEHDQSYTVDEMMDGELVRVDYQVVSQVGEVQKRWKTATRAGESTIVWPDKTPLPKSISWHEVSIIADLGDALQIENWQSLEWVESKSRTLAEFKREWQLLDRGVDVAQNKTLSIDEVQIKGVTEGDILASLRQANPELELPQDQYLTLKSWLSSHQDSVLRITEDSLSYPLSDSRSRALVKALGTLSSSESESALWLLYSKGGGGDDDKERILTTLGMVKSPTFETESKMNALSKDKNNPHALSATLALGIIGGRLREDGRDEARRRHKNLEDELYSRLYLAEQTNDVETLNTLLGALGNLGPNQIDQLKVLLESPDPALRGRAAFALRWSPNPEAASLLQAKAQQEKDRIAKRDIDEAISLRSRML